MDRHGAPLEMWLEAPQCMAYLLNHTWSDNIKDVPLSALMGITVDIGVLLRFHFWQRVYCRAIEPGFPSDSREEIGFVCGISEHVGHALCCRVCNPKTGKIIRRSCCREITPDDPNFRAEQRGGEDDLSRKFIKRKALQKVGTIAADAPEDDRNDKSTQSNAQDEPIPAGNADDETAKDGEDGEPKTPLIIHGPDDLIGRLFLLDPEADGQRLRARVVERLTDFENDLETNKERIKHLCVLNDDEREELLTHNQIVDFLTKDAENPVLWKFQRIVSVQGPLKPGHKDCNGSSCNVMVEWSNGEVTTVPPDVLAADDPVTCAQHARDNGLLDTPGWKGFKGIAKRDKKYFRMAKQAYLRSFCSAPKCKCGVEIPKDFKDAQRLDALNGNTEWADARALELSQIDECQCFEDKGHMNKVKAPEGHKRIRVHFVHDCKHDGRHKARLVADGHLTDAPLESVYSGVVSLRGFRMVMFLAELNNLEFWATDIGNAYLESHTAEKVHIIGGEEFGDRHGHILVICKALYGL